MQKNLIIILILSIFISVFAILNAGAVPINLFFTTLEISVALVILISATIGAVIVFSLDTAAKYKYKKKIRESNKQAEKLEKEKAELEEKIQWYEEELDRAREKNLDQVLDQDAVEETAQEEAKSDNQPEPREESTGKSRGLKDRWTQRKDAKKTSGESEEKSKE